MDSLQRAKNFLARKASKLALAVVPLAALAISAPAAKASTVTLDTSLNCTVTPVGTCETFQLSATGGNSNMNGIGLAGSGSSDISGGSIKFLATGSGAGILPAGSVPVSWIFNMSTGTLDPTVDWTILFQLNFTSGGMSFFQTSGSASVGSTPAHVQGTGSISTSGGTVTGYEIQLTTSDNIGAGGYSVTIPNASTLDLNPETSPVPEPSSLLVIGAAGVLMILRRRKKRA